MVINWIKLLAFTDDLVLSQDTNNCQIASISIHDYLEGSIELGEDWTREELCLEFVEGLLLYILTNECHIFCQIDTGAFLSTVVNDE